MALAPNSSIRPPQWVSAIALLAAAATFVVSLVTLAPPAVEDGSGYSREVRAFFAAEEWTSTVDLSRAHLETEPGSLQARFFLALALERRGFEGDAFEARQVWVDLRNASLEDFAGSERATPGAQREIRASVGYFGGWAHYKLGETEEARSRWEEAATLYERAAREGNRRMDYYIYSNVLALLGKDERALDAWYQAVARGYNDLEWVAADPDLTELREHPQFNLVRRVASGRLDRMVRGLYAECVESGSMRRLLDLLDRHLRFQPRDAEALLFRAFALEASAAATDEEVTEAWLDLDVAVRALAADEIEMRLGGPLGSARAAGDTGAEAGMETADRALVLSDDPVEASRAGVREGTLYFAAWAARGLGDLDRSRSIFAYLARTGDDPDRLRTVGLFNIACYSAMAGQIDRAWHALALTRFGGNLDPAWVRVDPDLASVRYDPRFEALLAAETRLERFEVFGAEFFESDEFGLSAAFDVGFGADALLEDLGEEEPDAAGSGGDMPVEPPVDPSVESVEGQPEQAGSQDAGVSPP
ncbi:MAG: hypothetical protein AAF297_11945 [Planctomycetota bacterium]